MKKNKSGFIQKAFLFLNFCLILCLLISYSATIIDPAKHWYIALFGLAYPFILLANVLFVLVWVMLKKWYFLYSLLFILMGYSLLNRTIGFRKPVTNDTEIDSNTIKLMTWNVHYVKKFGAELDTTTRSNVFKVINQEQPDIIGFEEFFTRKKGKYDIKDSILKILDTKHYYYSASTDNNYESIGVALFSKFPIVNHGFINLESESSGNRGIWVDVKKQNQVFRVFAVHLASISFQPEDYLFLNEVKTDINNGNDVVSSKRILRRLKNAFIRRSSQVKILKQEFASCTTPFIVMGDFNDTPVSYTLSQLSSDLKNGFYEKGSGLGITYNGAFPNFQIDYILTSQHFDFKTYKIIHKDYSDHYPVRCNVTLSN
ncbi:endonuclease/exonuclease/phosphatase family protein [Pelobium sp.]|nr:endonuclease/exonuclease/phosphatase family protein [Pelobium sp.]MDA9555005.1 endonuclease/exonuclease/phosphatase family protein [Pelobium sp.]